MLVDVLLWFLNIIVLLLRPQSLDEIVSFLLRRYSPGPFYSQTSAEPISTLGHG